MIRILFLTIIALSILAVMLSMHILFSNMYWYKLGSYSEMISSVSTFGSFTVLLLAYFKVSGWMRKKKNHIGYNHIVKMMSKYDEFYKDINPLFEEILEYKSPVATTKKLITIKLKKSIATHKELSNELHACNRWKISYLHEIEDSFNLFDKFYLSIEGILFFIEKKNEEIEKKFRYDLLKIKTEIDHNHELLKKDIDLLFSFKN